MPSSRGKFGEYWGIESCIDMPSSRGKFGEYWGIESCKDMLIYLEQLYMSIVCTMQCIDAHFCTTLRRIRNTNC